MEGIRILGKIEIPKRKLKEPSWQERIIQECEEERAWMEAYFHERDADKLQELE